MRLFQRGPAAFPLCVLLALAIALAHRTSAAPAPAAKAAATPARRPAPAADFSGRWALDLARTEFGPAVKTPPRSRIDVIEQRDPALRIESVTVRANGDTVRFTWRYATDGTETVNTVMGQQVRSTGRWDGAALAFESRARVMMGEFVTRERWSLSADRGTLTIQRTTRSPFGESSQKYVFARG